VGIIAKAAQQAGVRMMNKENPNHGPDGKFSSGGGSSTSGKDKTVHQVLTSRGYEKTMELHGDEPGMGIERTYEHPNGDVVMHNSISGWEQGGKSGTTAASLAAHLDKK
jgi:hypothetical protein